MEVYVILEVLWWGLLGVLLIGLGTMVGMDMGVGTLLRFIGRSDTERRVMLNTIGPHWEGNQVWFVLGGGAIFAAFPLIYATAFSGLYIVMMLLLWSMILRPLGFEYRSKIPSAGWRNLWDWALLVGGAVPVIIYGAAMGNMLKGVPFYFDWDMTSHYTGSFWALLNPFAILCGLLSLSLSIYMGGVMLMGRTGGDVQRRARVAASWGAIAAVVLFAIGGVWVSQMNGYVLTSSPARGIGQTPLQQTVQVMPGAWLHNYGAYPVAWLAPILGFAGMVLGLFSVRAGRNVVAWWLGAVAWAGVIATVGIAMFPFMMPSSLEPSQSLTLWNSISSQRTLAWMTGFSAVFVPLILWYTSWAFYVMRGTVKGKDIESDSHSY